ncbi:hypothetical protein VaNZ11_005604 [Volvox africanus]|uniref:Uncharacterized protein n=1 Tax=Volvox africanus TaxID=51714 RepID=A0ABQ5RZ08_9CHLO|nr:hypothetical protein VaNZ11_005604 [Volvox africanus]
MDAVELSNAISSGELYLIGRQLSEVPQSVFACCGLVLLDVSANTITSLPGALSELKGLTYLDVSFNQLHELPACLGALTALTCLKASYNQIERLHPQALVGLGGCLRELHLGDNALTLGGLPPQLSCLTRLAHLDLRYNHRLIALPPDLGCLVSPALAPGQGRGQGAQPVPGPAAAVPPATASRQLSCGVGGCLRYLNLEGCPLGECLPVEAGSRPGTLDKGGTGALQQQQQALYRRLKAATAAVVAAGGGEAAVEAEAQRGLAEALRQLHCSRSARPPSSPSSASSSLSGEQVSRLRPEVAGTAPRDGTAAGPGAGVGAAGTVGARADRVSGSGGRVDLLVLTPAPTLTCSGGIVTQSAGNAGGTTAAGAEGSRTTPAGPLSDTDSRPTCAWGRASGPVTGSGPSVRASPCGPDEVSHLQPLQLHNGAVLRSGGSGRGRLHLCQPQTDGLAGGGVGPETPGVPRSPLTDLRNSHADLELIDRHEEDGDVGPLGIDIVGPRPREATGQQPLSTASGDGSQAGIMSAALVIALEELSDLPPAAAAAMYRSLDVVASGVQEIREGRPLSRGGNSHVNPTSASAATRATGPACLPRPVTSASRPATYHQRRPGSSLLRPSSSSSSSSSYIQDPLRPRTHSSHVSKSDSSADRGSGDTSNGQQQRLTGALALLAAAGMRPPVATASGQEADGTGGWRQTGNGGADEVLGVGGGGGTGLGLGTLAPITFPLASGVRSMLRGVGTAANAGKPAQAMINSASMAVAHVSNGSAGVLTWFGNGEGDKAATYEGGDAQLAAELDRLAVVRRMLADRNPELVRALDEQMFEREDEDGEREAHKTSGA